MKFDIRQLIVFIEVVEQESFSRAAAVLGVAQASVSERIANLEKAIGVKLLNRLGRKIELTAAGAFLLERAKAIVSLKNQTDADLRALLGMERGDIHVGGSTAPGEYILPALMGQFAKNHPKLSLSLSIGDSHSVAEKVSLGELDVAVVGAKEKKENLAYRKVWTDDIVLVVDSENKLSKKRGKVSIKSLVDERWVVREAGSGTRAAIEKNIKKALLTGSVRRNIVGSFGSVAAVKEAVIAGLGIAFVSRVTAARELESGLLCEVKVQDFSMSRNFFVVRDDRRDPSPAADAFWKFILTQKSIG